MKCRSAGVCSNAWRVITELSGVESKSIKITRQILVAFAENLLKINPDLIWHHTCHNEASLIYNRCFRGMTPEQKESMRNVIRVLNLGGAGVVPDSHGLKAINFYSKQDFVTGWSAFARTIVKNACQMAC